MKKKIERKLNLGDSLKGGLCLLSLNLVLVTQPSFSQERAPALNDAQCVNRISYAITGAPASLDLLETAEPHDELEIDRMIATDAFKERFARFVNSEMNDEPGQSSAEDATYHMALYALNNNLKWSEVFVGKYNVVENNNRVRVVADNSGIGYIKSQAWMERYAGNEGNGVRINTAYRVMQNTFGLELVAADLPADADTTIAGRNTTQPCKSCHFDQVTALDPVANAFPNVLRDNNLGFEGFAPVSNEPVEVLGRNVVTGELGLMNLLVESLDHKYFVCETAYKFLTGREENTCNKAVMDKCLASFEASGLLQDAIKSIASDKTFCQ